MTRSLWSLLGMLLALVCWAGSAGAGIPDQTNSFYVPQAGLDYGNPLEGDEATPYFRACPNNDEGASLPLAARVKVVIRDSSGAPMSGIPGTDICVLLNGGTATQGFSGIGADSIAADPLWSGGSVGGCPALRCIQADAPSDANGVTYITFSGPGGVRDSNRKWGHYDSELPVYVMGFKIPGRLTSTATNGSYVLRIKNFDNAGSLLTILNSAERVTISDLNPVQVAFSTGSSSYWLDFDGDGEVGLADLNMIRYHFNHRCNIPNNP